jgi:hypothetical protein
MIPKLNPDFIAVQIGSSETIKIFSIQYRKFIREFKISNKV